MVKSCRFLCIILALQDSNFHSGRKTGSLDMYKTFFKVVRNKKWNYFLANMIKLFEKN